jgi:hypothetical protein
LRLRLRLRRKGEEGAKKKPEKTAGKTPRKTIKKATKETFKNGPAPPPPATVPVHEEIFGAKGHKRQL